MLGGLVIGVLIVNKKDRKHFYGFKKKNKIEGGFYEFKVVKKIF